MTEQNQISGYRQLSEKEVNMINQVKAFSQKFDFMIKHIKEDPEVDQIWLEAGLIDVKKGLMCVTRAIARPTV